MTKRAVGLLLALCMAITPVLAVQEPDTASAQTQGHIAAAEPAGNPEYACTGSMTYDENGEADAYWVYKYDPDGHLLRRTFYDIDGSMYYYTDYAYDAYGNLAEQVQYEPDGTMKETRTWRYDSRGNLLEEKVWSSDALFKWEEYEYDSRDNLLRHIYYNESGEVFELTEYSYDSSDRLTEQVRYWKGTEDYRSVFLYDTDGSVWETKTYEGEFHSLIHYAFNEAGQETVVMYCNEDGTPTDTWDEHVYDKNGNEIRYEKHHGDRVTWSNEYEFDDESRLIRWTELSSSGEVENYTLWEYDSNGNAVKKICYLGDGTVHYSYEHMYTPVTDLTAIDIFFDVNQKDWFTPYVNYCYDNGLMAGTGINFEPNTRMTRAMVVQILYKLAGTPQVSGSAPFTDVRSSAWYYDAVRWAYQNSYASGKGAGKFDPDGKVTRQEFAQFLYSYEGKPAVTGSLSQFPDEGKIDGWARDAMLWANQNGLINGKPKNGTNYLEPKGLTTRAEAAVMLKGYTDR